MISWLHISDWHQKSEAARGGRETAFARKEFLEKLIQDIKDRAEGVDRSLSKLDFVVFSGDLAHSGRRAEYEAALEEFLYPVLDAADVDLDKLFVVPGNHDVDRGALVSDMDGDFQSLSQSHEMDTYREKVSAILSHRTSRGKFLRPFDGFKEVLTGDMQVSFSRYDPRYFYRRTFEADGKKVSIVCLNSSWLSGLVSDTGGRVDDYGKLAVGEIQIHDAFRNMPRSDLVIVVMHHPLSWLKGQEANRVEELICKHSQFLLHGHQHVPRVNVSRSTDGDVVIIPAGAAFQERFPMDSRHVSSYNFVSVDPAAKSGTVFLRRWNDKRLKYTSDSDIWESGRFPFVLPELDRDDHSSRRNAMHGVEVAAAPYLNRKFSKATRLKISHAMREIGGFRVVEQHTEYTRDLKAGREPNFYLESWTDPFVLMKSKACPDIVPHRHIKLLIGEEEVLPVHDGGDVLVQRELGRNPVQVYYEYESQNPLLGVDTTKLNRFTEQFVLVLNKDPGLIYDISGVGGLDILEDEVEELNDGCVRVNLKRLLYPYQGVRVSWHPKDGSY